MSKFETVIWDLDGTLLDTLVDLKNAVNEAMRTFDYPERTLEEIRTFVGNGVRKLMELSIPDGLGNPNYESAYEVFSAYYKEHNLDYTKPYDGVVEVIKELSKRGIKQAIVSNKIDYAVKLLNDEFFHVDFCIGTQDGLRRKPDADMVLKALEELGAELSSAVYIGDSEVDIATAKNSNLPCISVLWGFRTKEELEPFRPECTVSKPYDLLKYFD